MTQQPSIRHAALASLGLAAVALAFEGGFDLRSQCVLVTSGPVMFEAVRRDGSVSAFGLTAADSVKLVAEAAARSAVADLPWRMGELYLRPASRLVELIRRSQKIAEVNATTGKEAEDTDVRDRD